ncbi:23819_t:CDS:10 [Dentiscutata erythropus]|uniref:23819_t:CDS:1 n=1 Tax=Dentiscutata erythropus TaxID=1348616 RepID=A0A9N8ZCA1_9GLOM|nr:23819_t:CDS:10 [Dentiscutata erythropus]
MTIRFLDNKTVQKLRAFHVSSVAQCVVELVQNSLDAMATTIEIHVDLTKYFIQVIDNGNGIPPTDMDKIGQRHATSKCHTLEDLAHIKTYGFRGEGLNSIGGLRLQLGPTRNSERAKPGTIAIIRDLFYTYPVRRKMQSVNTIANELENVKKAVEILALINPQVAFTLVDASIDRKIVNTRKASSTIPTISTFRQLYGASLAQAYVNKRFIANNELYKLIDDLFNQSNFGKKFNEDSILKSKSEFPGKSRKNVLTKSLEKYPIFFIHITCSTTDYDISLDPAKNIIEFENWPKIMDLLSSLVTQFLSCHGFLMQDMVASNVKNINASTNNNKSRVRPSYDLSLSFEDLTHIKSGGRQQYIFQDEELKGGPYSMLSKNVNESENILVASKKTVKIKENEYAKWTEPHTKQEFYIDTRTGNSNVPGQTKSASENCTKARIDRSRLRTSNDKNIIGDLYATSWAKDALEKWNNPVFQSYEAPIPLLKHISTCNKKSSVKSSFFSCNDLAQSDFVEHRFSKQDFAQAQVIGQVDDKFVACKLPYSRAIGPDLQDGTQQILVLVDQHAADERVRVEMLMKEFCDFKNKERMQNMNDNEVHPISSLVETVQINPPNKIVLTEREIRVVKRFEANFNSWGIFFSDNMDTKQDNASLSFTTPFVSPHFNASSTDNDHIPIYVTHLPKMIVDRCVFDSRVTQELLRQHLYWLEDTGGIGISNVEVEKRLDTNEQSDWKTIIRQCPRGIIDILNSKACRGAIKFNDKLTLNQCQELISELALCDFPFQCAHGRPSMIPIIYLDEFAKTTQASYRNKSQLKHNKLYRTNEKSETTFDQLVNFSWKKCKINLEQFRL